MFNDIPIYMNEFPTGGVLRVISCDHKWWCGSIILLEYIWTLYRSVNRVVLAVASIHAVFWEFMSIDFKIKIQGADSSVHMGLFWSHSLGAD